MRLGADCRLLSQSSSSPPNNPPFNLPNPPLLPPNPPSNPSNTLLNPHLPTNPTRIGTYGAELGCFSQHLKLIDGLLKSAPRESLLATQSLHLENLEDEKIYKQTLIFGTGSYISTVYCIHELTCMAANTSATRIFSTRLLFHLFIFIKIILSIYICSSLLRDHFLSSTVLVVWIWHGL